MNEATSAITGTVTRVNDKGLMLDTTQQWHNLSKFSALMPPMQDHAAVGQRVMLQLDKQGYIRGLSPLQNGTVSPPAAQNGRATNSQVVWDTADVPTSRIAAQSVGDRETQVRRLAVLNTARQFLTDIGGWGVETTPLDALDVLRQTASELEAWVLRDA